jgi:hypothetical protein
MLSHSTHGQSVQRFTHPLKPSRCPPTTIRARAPTSRGRPRRVSSALGQDGAMLSLSPLCDLGSKVRLSFTTVYLPHGHADVDTWVCKCPY